MPEKKQTPAEQEAALEELRRLGHLVPGAPGPPGAAGSSPTLVHGRYATCTVGGSTVHLFDYEIQWEMDTFDATAHGEIWKTFVAGDQSWTARAQGYYVASDAVYLAQAKTAADPTAVLFTAYKSVFVTAAQRIWAGNVLITRGRFSAPMGMVTQEFELQGTGVPTIGPT